MVDGSPPRQPASEATHPSESGPATEREAPAEGDFVPAVIGRYRVGKALGHGGMGSVHLAHDDALDRPIALKIVRGDQLSGAAQLRLSREAQALARLSHPNVVEVYEAGTWQGRGFIAMALVRGTTLARWARPRRPWRQVAAAFRLAGRGLLAAHAVGIVHRDFKPANVMIDETDTTEARVKLLDFGIFADDRAASSAHQTGGAEVDGRLTRTGAVLGTGPYMSPEQHAGAEATAASDQYAFCVSLYECLYGALPFRGATHPALLEHKRRGPPPRPAQDDTPGWLWALVARGLAPRPEDRFGSMAELLAALDGPPAGRRSWLAGGVVVAPLLFWLWPADDGPHCDGRARLAEVYDERSREAITVAFERTGTAYAVDATARVLAELDRYGTGWTDAYREVCLRHAGAPAGPDGERGGQLDRQMACLERRRADLRALVDVLGAADEAVMRRAVTAAHGLGPVDACAVTTAPASPSGDPIAGDARARARALRAAGRYQDALVEARVAVAAAAVDDLAARLELTLCLTDTGALHDAEAEGSAVFFAARGTHDDDVARAAATAMVRVVGIELGRPDEGLEWIRHARALPVGSAAEDAELLALEGAMLHGLGRLDDAAARYGDAVARIEQTRGVDDADLASPLNNLGALASDRGDFTAALAHHRRSLAIKEATLGPQHPFVASSVANIGNVYSRLGQPERALEHYRRADAIRSEALGPDHPEVLIAHVNTAVSLIRLGRTEDAQGELLAALGRMERVFGPDHPHVALVLSNLGSVSRTLGRPHDAASYLARAIAIQERIEGLDSTSAIGPMVNLSNLRLAQGDARGALALSQAAHARIDHLGGAHGYLGHVLESEAEALLALDRPAEALGLAERAVALRRDGDAEALAQSRFALARARWATGDRAGALAAAEEAVAAYARAPATAAGASAQVARWIAERPVEGSH